MHYLFAFLAHASLGAGNVLMKKGIDWIGWKGHRNSQFTNNLLTWITGFLIMNSSGIFTTLAVKRLSPHLISSFAGFGILIMILMSRLFLKENLYKSDISGAFLIVVSITLLSFHPLPETRSVWYHPNMAALIFVLIFPLLFLISGYFSFHGKAALYAVCSGSASGVLIVLLKMLVARYDYRISQYFSSFYLYLYVFFALLALISLQLALKKGPMLTVGPIQYSSLVIYPALVSALLGIPLTISQWPLFLSTATGIWIILRKR